MSLKLGRRFYGCEIKDEYIREARRNLELVCVNQEKELTLF